VTPHGGAAGRGAPQEVKGAQHTDAAQWHDSSVAGVVGWHATSRDARWDAEEEAAGEKESDLASH
jgi:hypothetical protein